MEIVLYFAFLCSIIFLSAGYLFYQKNEDRLELKRIRASPIFIY